MNDLTAMHLLHNIYQMNYENNDKPLLQLLTTPIARVHQILPHAKHYQSALQDDSSNKHLAAMDKHIISKLQLFSAVNNVRQVTSKKLQKECKTKLYMYINKLEK